MKYILKNKNKLIKKHILLKYFSIKAGNDNKKLNDSINELIKKLKQSGLKITLNRKTD
jgi:hypothetical protein